MVSWPYRFPDFAFMPKINENLRMLACMSEKEDWTYKRTSTEYENPILYNYIQHTYARLAEEQKLVVSIDSQRACFNSGLVTPNQEEIFLVFEVNKLKEVKAPWHFCKFCRKGEYDLSGFSSLPDMAHYFDDPSRLVFDPRKEIRVNIEHIITDNKERFPEPYKSMDNYMLQTFIRGAIENAKQRVKRSYKTAIPQYYRGGIQLLLPLCISNPQIADLAIVLDDGETFYRASTCLTLDMAYNNARQLARPDRDWLQP